MIAQWKFVSAAVLVIACGCSRATETEKAPVSGPAQVSLALNWFPEAEHGGFYAAQIHGFFQQEGLQVDIRSGGPGAPVIQQVAAGRVEFSVANADQVLLGRDQQAPVVAVMAAMQDSPRCIMVHAESGITDLLQLRDLTLAIGSGKPFARFLLSKLGDASLTIVPYQGNVAMFLERQDFAQQAYVFSEPHVARQQGADPRCLMLSDIGFNPYMSLLVTTEDLIAERPELVAGMVRACVRGWQKYLDDPDLTNRHIQKLNQEMSLATLAYGAARIKPLCLPDGWRPEQFGQMDAARWQTLSRQLVEIDLLQDRQAWERAFDTQFLPAAGSNNGE